MATWTSRTPSISSAAWAVVSTLADVSARISLRKASSSLQAGSVRPFWAFRCATCSFVTRLSSRPSGSPKLRTRLIRSVSRSPAFDCTTGVEKDAELFARLESWSGPVTRAPRAIRDSLLVIWVTVLDGSTRNVTFAVADAPDAIEPNEQAIGPHASAEHDPWLVL